MPVDFRCSLASADDDEPIAGTAPTETDWLFVEQRGPWAAKATGHLAGLVGVNGRAQLIRRHGGGASPGAGVRLFRATLGDTLDDTPTFTTALIDDVDSSADPADPAYLARIAEAHFTPYDGPLWLVCTNGRRDRCCAERGRPVAAALAARWPEATWETTHLGGHRFAATLLALPHAITLGRLDPASAVSACAGLEQGRLELDVVRGHAGRPSPAQAAELHLRRRHGWVGLDDVTPVSVSDGTVTLRTPDGPVTVTMESVPGDPRRPSCADEVSKVLPTWQFVSAVPG